MQKQRHHMTKKVNEHKFEHTLLFTRGQAPSQNQGYWQGQYPSPVGDTGLGGTGMQNGPGPSVGFDPRSVSMPGESPGHVGMGGHGLTHGAHPGTGPREVHGQSQPTPPPQARATASPFTVSPFT